MKKLLHLRKFFMIGGILSVVLLSCEDIIYPTLESAAPILVVDGWLNNKPETQVIFLTRTQPYFENAAPPGASGAVVTVSDDHNKTYSFVEDDKKPGRYQWKPAVGEVFGTVGYKYKLSIQLNGEAFTSSAYMGRVPKIDSISFDKDKRTGTSEEIIRGEFWATDPVGTGDTYWVRAFKNGVHLNKPSEIVVAFDAGFSAGSETDGVIFIAPLRRGINARDTDANGKALSPFVAGDSIQVQLHSITLAAFNYLKEVQVQTDRPGGFRELFSKPLSNVSTNITNVNTNGSNVVGFFNVSAVSASGKRYVP